MQQRINCRKKHLILRNEMTKVEVEAKSQQIISKILETSYYKEANCIYGYYPLGNEADIRPLLEHALSDGKKVCLPRTGADCSMEFYEIHSLEHLKEGAFHVMEPAFDAALIQNEKALVLVPGVVFDREGNRYGYGKGYYDRYFYRFPELYRFAICFEHQLETDELEVSETDVKMHLIFTEKGIYNNGIKGNM